MDLPYELSEQIISYLAPRDLVSMCLVHSSHLKTAKRYLYREVSAPLSLAGIQRFLEISRDPTLSPLVCTFRCPARAVVLIKGVRGDQPGLPSDQTQVLGDDATDIVLRQGIPEEYHELVEANNREFQEQRRLLFSSEHGRIIKEAVRNLPNLTGLNLQLGCFKVNKVLQPLVEAGNCVVYSPLDSEPEFRNMVHNILSEILFYPKIPVSTVSLEGAGTLPKFWLDLPEGEKCLQLVRALGDTRTLRFQFDPVINYTSRLMPRVKFFIPSGGVVGGLRRLSIVATQQISDLPVFPLK